MWVYYEKPLINYKKTDRVYAGQFGWGDHLLKSNEGVHKVNNIIV